MLFLAHDQLQRAVTGQGSDGVLAHRQADQRLHQGLRLQAHQVLEGVWQQASAQGLAQRLAQAIQFHLGFAVQAMLVEPGLDARLGLARKDFHQVAGLPVHLAALRRTQAQ
ncbi:hypothetical protein D3C76_1246620 [compost metagenome]